MVRKRSISVTASLEPPRHTSLLEPRQLPLTLTTKGPICTRATERSNCANRVYPSSTTCE